MAELVDALALGASGVTRESSSLSFRTNDNTTQDMINLLGLYSRNLYANIS